MNEADSEAIKEQDAEEVSDTSSEDNKATKFFKGIGTGIKNLYNKTIHGSDSKADEDKSQGENPESEKQDIKIKFMKFSVDLTRAQRKEIHGCD